MKNIKRKLEFYEQLFGMFGPGESECQISQLAELWSVTERHVFTLIKALEQDKWIYWHAKSGRNKRASLSCLIEPIEACYLEAHRLAEKGRVDELLNILSFGGRDAGKELQVFLNHASGTTKQVVYIPFHRTIEPLHPHKVLRRTERFLIMQTYQRLTQAENGKLTDDLAYHWAANQDATVWQFQVRSHVLLHDGTALNTKDMVRSLTELTLHPHWSSCYQHVSAVKRVSDNLIEVELNQPDWHLPRMLARAEASVFRLSTAPSVVGSGAFAIDVFSHNMLRLNRNDRYSNQLPIIDRAEVWFYPDWAVSKQCAYNQIRLQIPENTKTLGSECPAVFLYLSNPRVADELKTIAVEDTSNAQQLFEQDNSVYGDSITIEYGDYSQVTDALLCSLIEENDPFSAWLSLLLRLPFHALGLSSEWQAFIQSQLDAIRGESNLDEAWKLLNALKEWLRDQQILTELQRETFQLEVSERLKGNQVNGFGWSQLNELWVDQV